MTAPTLVRTTDKGTIVPVTLTEWAAKFNADHRLPPPKERGK
jgi:hypothetical protein